MTTQHWLSVQPYILTPPLARQSFHTSTFALHLSTIVRPLQWPILPPVGSRLWVFHKATHPLPPVAQGLVCQSASNLLNHIHTLQRRENEGLHHHRHYRCRRRIRPGPEPVRTASMCCESFSPHRPGLTDECSSGREPTLFPRPLHSSASCGSSTYLPIYPKRDTYPPAGQASMARQADGSRRPASSRPSAPAVVRPRTLVASAAGPSWRLCRTRCHAS